MSLIEISTNIKKSFY